MNALDEVSEVGLTEVVRAAAVDAEVRALILLAEGKAFSAGEDFELMLRCNGDPVLYIVAHVGQVSW